MIHLVGDFDFDTPGKTLSVNRSQGLLILHPDILVSSTKVADSSQCTRKALLQEIIRSTSAPTPSLAFGNMLHELMQRCLMENQWDADFTNKVIDEIVTENGSMLWSMDLTGETAKSEILERSKEFPSFAQQFVGSTPKVRLPLSRSIVRHSLLTCRYLGGCFPARFESFRLFSSSSRYRRWSRRRGRYLVSSLWTQRQDRRFSQLEYYRLDWFADSTNATFRNQDWSSECRNGTSCADHALHLAHE